MSRPPSGTLLFLCVLLIESNGAWAQSGLLTGTVSNARGKPLIGADVSLIGSSSGTEIRRDIADRNGRYVFRRVPFGDYEIVARFVGFAKTSAAVTMSSDGAESVDLQMEQTNILMEPVIISASRRPEKALNAPSSVSVVTAKELEADPVLTLPGALRNVVGVDVAQHGLNHTYLSVRGFQDNYIARTLPLLDYRDMHGPGFNDAFYLLMPIETLDLERIEIVRGPGSALYGPGVAQGVVHFFTKNPFDYPGTTLFAETGERQIERGGFRHAGVIGTRLGYKMVGGYFSGEDWHFNPINSQDAEILGAMADSLIDLDGNVVGELGGRTYDISAAFVKADASYKIDDQTTIVANLAYSRVKNSFNGSGEWQWDPVKEVYGQLRMTSGRLFAQTSFAAVLPGRAFNYRTGLIGHNTSSEFGVQVQHGLEILNGWSDLTGGLDFQRSIPRTRGSLMGRNEDHDDFYTTGTYLQSQTHVSPLIDLTLSGRLDYFSPTEELLLSPRGALLFKLAPEHSLRLTYNRATGSVRGLAYFMDFITEDNGAFQVRLRGNANGFTFSDPLATTSFVTIPGFPAQDDGVGISLQRAYTATTSGLVAPGAPLGESEELANLLWSRMPQITGISQGVLSLAGQPVEGVKNQDPVKPLIANTFEVGYKGLLLNRIALGVDAYYTRRERFLNFQIITPFVVVPGLGQDLSDAVSTLFTNEELAPYDLTTDELAALYENAGSSLAGLLGIVEPVENFDPNTRPELLLINSNFGRLDYWGIDVSAEAILNDRVTTFANTSWVSDNFFDANELGESGAGYVVSMNAPQTRVRLGLAYADPIGFDLRGSMRYVQSFEVRDDLPLYSGKVEGYTIVDVGAGYDFGSTVAGLRLDVATQNFFNNRHREYIGVPKIGRLVTARLTYSL